MVHAKPKTLLTSLLLKQAYDRQRRNGKDDAGHTDEVGLSVISLQQIRRDDLTAVPGNGR